MTDGSGFSVPSARWIPENERQFIRRADELMTKWFDAIFRQQRLGPASSSKGKSDTEVPLYTIDLETKTYDWKKATVTYSIAHSQRVKDTYQDGTSIKLEQRKTLYHATRDVYIAAILH